ncbi:MAG: hypothetical protein WC300_01025 [Candidatus Omnitrophota bacterium]
MINHAPSPRSCYGTAGVGAVFFNRGFSISYYGVKKENYYLSLKNNYFLFEKEKKYLRAYDK